MQFQLNKTQLTKLIAAFRNDKLPKSVRKINNHGIERDLARIEASGISVQVDSGRVKLTLAAEVGAPGAFTLRDHVLRELLGTLREEKSLRVTATPDGLDINGAAMNFAAGTYQYFATPN